MFGFYKDLFLKINGIEPKSVLKPVEKPKEEKLLFSNKLKVTVWILGIMYLIVAGIGIYMSFENNVYSSMLKYVFLVPLDVASLILVLSKNKRKQFVAVGTIFLFIVFNFGTTLK